MFNIFKKQNKNTSDKKDDQISFTSSTKLLGQNKSQITEPNQSNVVITKKIEAETEQQNIGWFKRLQKKLAKGRSNFNEMLHGVKIDEKLYEKLEEALIISDVGIDATNDILDKLKISVKENKIKNETDIRIALINIVKELLLPLEAKLKIGINKPTIIMFVGVNGAGKTTTIGKLAKHLLNYNQKVLLAAGDTFRAAAREQLIKWGEKNQVPVIEKQGHDPASVIFDAIKQAKLTDTDVVLADTAGRLSTQRHLMHELIKIKKVIGKAEHGAPHEILLVVDGSNGQNALSQVVAFSEALNITGLIITKLDGGAKGGILAAIARSNPKPVYFLGLGEQLDDLQPFNATNFAHALFEPIEQKNETISKQARI